MKCAAHDGGGGAQLSASGCLQTLQRTFLFALNVVGLPRRVSQRPGSGDTTRRAGLAFLALAADLLACGRSCTDPHSYGRCGMPASIAASATVSSIQLLVEVDLGRGGDAVGLLSVEDLVEVGGDDVLLALLTGERLRQLEGLEDLHGLAHVQALLRVVLRDDLGGQEPRTDELLGDRGRTAAVAAATELLGHRVDGGLEIEARVLPERVVLDGGRDVEDERRDLVVARSTSRRSSQKLASRVLPLRS